MWSWAIHRGERFFCRDEISIREWTEQLAERAIGFQRVPAYGVAPGNDRKLVHGAVGAKDGPTGLANPSVDLRKPLAAIERLVVLAGGMTQAGIEFIEAHEIGIVGRGEEEFTARRGDTVKFAKGGLHLGQMLDGLARNHDVKSVVGKGRLCASP